jgi:solute carrier family 36 (proton-coupled amino acid transporter)
MFYTGGLAFSTVVLVSACALSIYNIILLSRAHDRLAPQHCRSYGDIVFVAWGRPGKWVVDFFQAVNQISWVPVYFIFVQQNLAQAIPGLGRLPRETLIALQLLVYVPLSLLRHIKYLSSANLVANVFVCVGLVACIAWSCVVLAQDGPAPDVQMFNPSDCFLFLGAVAVSFEGMSLVLPIKVRPSVRPFVCLFFCLFVCSSVMDGMGKWVDERTNERTNEWLVVRTELLTPVLLTPNPHLHTQPTRHSGP